ncbi:MAG: 16S rRNA (cytosine(1402)-N(4))-methyltransferase RsmH [Candidatus Cloacimonadota bacterium]|nr:16S rRNA (cytosine(1402)-N(4))-methyltransferase RsmH [Candidatus Cloacimonadota bacterium]
MENYHIPVLRQKAVDLLNIKKGGIYVDATTGGGGHLASICDAVDDIRVIALDKDSEAIEFAQNRCRKWEDKIIFVNKNFSYLTSALALNRIRKIDGILFDLGVSSHQITAKDRGFSFQIDEKLDMRMDKNAKLSAFQIVNYYDLEDIVRIIYEFGEEKYRRRIANNIVRSREKKKIVTTFELKKIIENAIPYPNKKTLARVFQAFRIEVNKELEVLEKALKDSVDVLNENGRIVVISYHSLEDRIVKNFFKYEEKECICPPNFPKCVCDKEKRLEIITKKPITPANEEVKTNPQARSAKLRAAERC